MLKMNVQINKIDNFKGTYAFLSNFYNAPVTYDGIAYSNNEAAFQAQKCTDDTVKAMFANLNPSQAKRLGRSVQLRPDWELVKYDVMYEICKAKFEQNEDLRDLLIATGDAYLEEGNTWNDRCWGTCKGVGENNLGKILMRVREELTANFFSADVAVDCCIEWIKEYFEENGPDCNAIIGISGGKDSAVVAALCCSAIGADRVIGVLMPNGRQEDFQDAVRTCDELGIARVCLNVKDAVGGVYHAVNSNNKFPSNMQMEMSEQAATNLVPRIRMAMLYAVAQSMNGRVANTGNLSERYIGWTTYNGDSLGDFAPLANFTSDEVIAMGNTYKYLDFVVNKVPADGLTGKTDEEKTGIPYGVLNKYIRTGICEDEAIKEKIDRMNERSAFKFEPMPTFDLDEYLEDIDCFDEEDWEE
jgi:NAD+ synthase